MRGGNAYQNLVTMDGMTIYNPAHMMGIFSTFNDDAMSRATLYKGPVPSRFGGATSSVLETTMVPGNPDAYNFSGTIGLLNAKIFAGGPIVKNKLSFAVAARTSYVDLFLKMIPKYRHTEMNFFDVNAKVRYIADSSNIVDFSFFAARDNLAISDLMEMHWGNIAGSVNWSARCGDRWKFLTTAAVTDYTTNMVMDMMDTRQQLREYIRSFSLNGNARYAISDNHELEFGLRSELLRVNSADAEVNGNRMLEIRSGLQNALWVGYDGRFSDRWSLSVGARFSLFSALSQRNAHAFSAISEETPDFSSKNYFDPEPRGSVTFYINDCHNLKAGAALTTQNIHGIRSTMTTFPFDRYALTSSNVRPERTALYSFGYSGMVPDGGWDWSAEIYYKSMRNVYDYLDGMTMLSRINLESIITGGKGRSYGMELMLRKNTGRLNGWVSYTLSQTQTRINDINGSRWYDASNDRRHDIAIVAIYNLSDAWKLSGSWTFSS